MTRVTRWENVMQSPVGVWKLVEVHAFDEAGREVPSPLGPQPMGVAIINAERVMAMAGDGRPTEVANLAFSASAATTHLMGRRL
jgi:hypothetical protein